MKTRHAIAVLLAVLLATAGVASALPNPAGATPASGDNPTSEAPVTPPADGDHEETDDEKDDDSRAEGAETVPVGTPNSASSDVPTASSRAEPDTRAASGAPADRPARGPSHGMPDSVPSKVQTIHQTVGQYLDDAVTGKQGHAVSAVAAADAARPGTSTDDDSDADGLDDGDESATAVEAANDVDAADGVDETVDARGPAAPADRLPDHVKQVHQTVRDFLASLFGGASDE